jgi:hypothetical protein
VGMPVCSPRTAAAAADGAPATTRANALRVEDHLVDRDRWRRFMPV